MITSALCNALIVDAARTAADAVLWLDTNHCTVREIDIRSRRPLIRIDPPPAGGWLKGALRKRITERGITRTVYVTSCQGATVEWEVRRHCAPEVVQA